VLDGKRPTSEQLFTGAFRRVSRGIARERKDSTPGKIFISITQSRRAPRLAHGESYCNCLTDNSLNMKSGVNHNIIRSPPLLPLIFILLAVFI
jgi:hypothetical protein